MMGPASRLSPSTSAGRGQGRGRGISIGDVVKDIIRNLEHNVGDLMGYIMTGTAPGADNINRGAVAGVAADETVSVDFVEKLAS